MEISLKEVIKEYENGASLEEISAKAHESISMIKSRILVHGGRKGQEILLKELKKEIPIIETLIQEYQQRNTIEQLSEKYHESKDKIFRAIKQYQVIINKNNLMGNVQSPKKIRNDLQIEKIIQGYRNGDTWAKLEIDNNASATAIRKRVYKYIEENGNQIEEERNNAIKQRKMQKQIPINEIKNKRKQGYTLESIGNEYNLSETTIRNRLRKEKLQNENIKKEENIQAIINLNMIINYFRVGYNLDKVQKFAEEQGYKINESDIETARKIENGELKVASEASIAEIIKKYGYSYEKLVEIGKKKGYVITFESYISVKMYNDIKKQKEISKKTLEGEEK